MQKKIVKRPIFPWWQADEQQRKLDASVTEEQAREYVRKQYERNENRGKPYPVSRDAFINDYD